MGETLPTHKDPPTAGGKFPLQLTGGHTRWSIHAAWRDDRTMLRQQRGEPIAYMSAVDAVARGISDGDHVRVHNDLDAFEIMGEGGAEHPARSVSSSTTPGRTYQFRGQKGFQNSSPRRSTRWNWRAGNFTCADGDLPATEPPPDRGHARRR